MNKQLKIWSLALSMLVVVAMNSCKDDPALPDNLATFEAATVGFEGSSKDVKVILSRAESADVSLTISLTPTGVVYGTQFTTTPAAISNALTLVIPAGSTEASFKVTKPDGVFLEGTESINFTITGATNPIVLGETLSVKLSFSAIVSDGSQLTLQGIAATEAGTSAANAVFVNFKSNTQTSVLRSSWDLGFYSGTDFRVVLNNTRSAGAKVTTATNLADVAAADTVGLTLAVSQSAPAPAHYAFFDGLDGSLSSTVIPAISSTADDNKVIIINRGTGGGVAARPWIKAKITRNANGGYTIQYGTIKQTSGFTSVDIAKDAAYNFKFLSFNSGTTVDVEPKKTDWDFYWSYSLYQTTFGGNLVPYNFSDMVAINTQGGVKVAEVLTSTVSYDNYSESNIASSTFTSGRFSIGSAWRTATSDASPHVLTDRFYVIQGASGNVYKLKFISFHPSEGGTRGKPVIQYKLVKKAS